MKQHPLKVWPDEFKALDSGIKTFEIRHNDRDFKVGNYLILAEFDLCKECNGAGRAFDSPDYTRCTCGAEHGVFTGCCRAFEGTYMIQGEFGLPEDPCAMQLKPS